MPKTVLRTVVVMKRIPQPFGRKVWGYRSSDEEIQGSVWHFPFPSVEESKTTAGRTRHRNRYIDGNKPSRPLRIAAKSAVEESGSFLEQDSTTVPKSAYLRFCPCGKSCWGVPSPNPAYAACAAKNLPKPFGNFAFLVVWVVKGAACLFQTTTPEYHAQKGVIPIAKRYNTPHRSHVVKTRMTEEEYADFTGRLEHYDISQAEFIRQAITRATIRPVVTISPVNDELLAAVGKLTAEYGKIGGNLNQIARALNEYGTPYNALSGEVRAAIADLAALKFEVLRKVGEAVGNIQTYQL